MNVLRHQIPLSPTDTTRWAQVNLPADLSQDEADHLKGVVDALVSPAYCDCNCGHDEHTHCWYDHSPLSCPRHEPGHVKRERP